MCFKLAWNQLESVVFNYSLVNLCCFTFLIKRDMRYLIFSKKDRGAWLSSKFGMEAYQFESVVLVEDNLR